MVADLRYEDRQRPAHWPPALLTAIVLRTLIRSPGDLRVAHQEPTGGQGQPDPGFPPNRVLDLISR
jgi:hypothetical protein